MGHRINTRTSGSAFPENTFTLYGYNNRNEVQTSSSFLGADLTDQTKPVYNEERFYDYDPIGNRINVLERDRKTIYKTNKLNQYEKVQNQSTITIDYDHDGNLSEKTKDVRTTRCFYNAENRLVAVEPATPKERDTRSVYLYDYIGRRVGKKVCSLQSGKWQLSKHSSFIYDGWNLITEVDQLKNSETNYIWGLDLSQSIQGAGGIGGLVAKLDNEGVCSYFFDANGNIGQLVNHEGELASTYKYDPYGNIIETGGNSADSSPFRFSTKYFDDESGLYYYGYRFYVPQLGRWVNRDAFGEHGGLNLNQFVNNNPSLILDPLGLYGIDAHLGLTHYLATMAGFCEEDARLVADWNQWVDDNPSTNPFYSWLRYFEFGFGANSLKMRRAMNPHFPIDPTNTKSEATVIENSEYVQRLVKISIYDIGTIKAFGSALHTYQDSWAHRGFRNNHASDLSDPDKTWIQHRADIGGRDYQMAKSTYNRMTEFLLQNRKFRCKCPVEFHEIESNVIEYLSTSYLKNKERILNKLGLQDYAKSNPNYDSTSNMEGYIRSPFLYRMIYQEVEPIK